MRLTPPGSQTVVLDAGNQTLAAGQNYILVVAPPETGTRYFGVSSSRLADQTCWRVRE